MYDEVYSGVSAQLSIYCSGTSAIASAIEVLDFYCSAAKNEVVVTVTDSASYSYPTASRESRTRPSGVQETSGGNANNTDVTQGKDGGGGGGLGRGAIIAVAVVVSVAGIIAIASIIWFFRRRFKRQAAAAVTSDYLGQPELAGHMLSNDQSPQELSNEQSPKELAGSLGVVNVQARPVQVQELDANEKIQR